MTSIDWNDEVQRLTSSLENKLSSKASWHLDRIHLAFHLSVRQVTTEIDGVETMDQEKIWQLNFPGSPSFSKIEIDLQQDLATSLANLVLRDLLTLGDFLDVTKSVDHDWYYLFSVILVELRIETLTESWNLRAPNPIVFLFSRIASRFRVESSLGPNLLLETTTAMVLGRVCEIDFSNCPELQAELHNLTVTSAAD